MYAFNDTMRSYLSFPPQFPSTFVLFVKTNTAYWETSYNIKDDQGNIIFTNGPLQGNVFYRDTLTLAPGCYKFTIDDTGKDGLSFFANNDGTGYARFLSAFGGGVIQFMESDFGTSLSQWFTVGFLLSSPTIDNESQLNIFPNPASESFTVDLALTNPEPITIVITDVNGKVMLSKKYEATGNLVTELTLDDAAPGLYFIRVQGTSVHYSKKLMWTK